MKVRELMDILENCDPECDVVMEWEENDTLTCDSLDGVDRECFYVAESATEGTVYNDCDLAESAGYTNDEWSTLKSVSPKVVVLWTTRS